MDDRFRSALMSVFLCRFFLILAFVLIVAIIDIMYLAHKKKEILTKKSGRKSKRIQDYEKTKRSCMAEFFLGLVGVVVFFYIWALPPLHDLHEGKIVKSEAIYSRNTFEKHTCHLKIGGDIFIATNEDVFLVELFPGFSEEDFPQGSYQAVVWYGENSKILLQVILGDGND